METIGKVLVQKGFWGAWDLRDFLGFGAWDLEVCGGLGGV